MLNLADWPKGMRVIVRKERPHPGAQLRFTDIDGHRFTCFATSTQGGQLADLELRHRRRARCEDRIRCAKDTGLRNLPLHGYTQNQIWCEITALACELLAWMQMLALSGHARRGNPSACGCGCSASPAASSAVAGGTGYACQLDGPGPPRSPPLSGGFRPWHPADQPDQPLQKKGQPRARGTPLTRHDSRVTRHDRTLKQTASHYSKPPTQDDERSSLAGVIFVVNVV